jgi:O-antigen biosynthesis protein
MMSNILLISHNLNLEGAPIFLLSVAEAYIEAGHKVTVLSEEKGLLVEKFEKMGAKVSFVPLFAKDGPKKVSKFIEKEGFDVVVSNTIVMHEILIGIKNINCQKLWVIHESEIDHYKKILSFTAKSFDCADKVVFVAHETAKLYEEYKKNDDHFVVIHNGMDSTKIDEFKKKNPKKELKAKYGHSKKDKVFLNVGTICQRKGQVDLIESIIDLFINAKLDDHTYFYFVGFRNIYDGGVRCKELVEMYSMQDKIRIIDMSDKAFEYYGFADYYLCNSYIESFPLTILEAMAFELPIASSDVYGIKEQLTHKKNGLIFPAGRHLEIKESILTFFKNNQVARQYAKAAYKKLKLDFSIEKMKKEYVKLIKK